MKANNETKDKKGKAKLRVNFFLKTDTFYNHSKIDQKKARGI